jgi:lysozyme
MEKITGKKSAAIYISTLLILAGIAMACYYISRAPYHPNRFRYKGFGIVMPGNYAIHGIDVSHYQSTINWQDVTLMEFNHVKIGFSFIKATEGADKVDENYIANWYEAKQLGMPVGAYHFFCAGTNGKEQAQNFIEIANLEKGDLPPVLDIEQANEITDDELSKEIQDWLDAVEKNYHITPIIYTNSDFYESHLQGRFDKYPLWIANYLNDDKPHIGRSWTFWQHSESGHANGIGGFVDFNVFNGDSTNFQNLLIK